MTEYEKTWAQQTDPAYIHHCSTYAEFWESGKYYADTYYSNLESNSVLDFGCGVGRVSKFIQCKELYLHDVNNYFLSQAITNTGGKVWNQEEVDCIISVSVFIHMRHVDAENIFKQCAEYAKQKMILQIPIYDVGTEASDWISVSTYTQEQIEAWCKDAGFKVTKLFKNSGQFSYHNIGPNHPIPHVFERV